MGTYRFQTCLMAFYGENPRLLTISTNSVMWDCQGHIQHAGIPPPASYSTHRVLSTLVHVCGWVRISTSTQVQAELHSLLWHKNYHVFVLCSLLKETLSPLLSRRDSATWGDLVIFYLIKRAKYKTTWQSKIPCGLKQGHGEVNVGKSCLPGSHMYL